MQAVDRKQSIDNVGLRVFKQIIKENFKEDYQG